MMMMMMMMMMALMMMMVMIMIMIVIAVTFCLTCAVINYCGLVAMFQLLTIPKKKEKKKAIGMFSIRTVHYQTKRIQSEQK